MGRFRAWLLAHLAPPAVAPPTPRAPGIRPGAEQVHARRAHGTPYTMDAAGSRPPSMAMDSTPEAVSSLYQWATSGALTEGLGFLGYPYLAELSQRAEYRRIVSIYAEHATRKWIKLKGDEEKVSQIEKAMDALNVRSAFREAAEHDGFFGRAQIFLDVGNPTAVSTPLTLRKETVKKGALKRLKVVEPMWSYPGAYEATDPLDATFYKPGHWQIQRWRVHSSRLLTFIGRPVPDLLKPAYAFGGLSLTQMAKPYVDNWLEARESVNDLLKSFSTMALATDMGALLAGGNNDDLIRRADLFTRTRDNRGLMLFNKDTEELSNVTTPLGTLDKLQAQAQEHIASVTGIPLVILLGVTPSGLNASSDGEVRTFYDTVHAYQEQVFRGPMDRVLALIQLSQFGEIDDDITYEFLNLWEVSENERASIRKADADIDVAYVHAGVVSPEEVRARLADDEDSPYFNVDLSAPAPEAPDDAEALAGPGPEEADAGGPPDPAQDAGGDFKEEDHPRAENGQFGSGGGGASPAGEKKKRDGRADPAPGPSASVKPEKAPHPRIAEILGPEGVAKLRALVADKNSTAAEIANVLAPIEASQKDVAPTLAGGRTPDAAFWAGRAYKNPAGEDMTAREAGDYLIGVAEAYAGPGGVQRARKVRILIGPPAAGKSTSAEEIARQGGYAIVDGDDAKKVIPEFDGGVGASAVHEESGFMSSAVLLQMMARGDNIILPLVGGSAASIRKRIELMRAAPYNYDVTIDFVDVAPDEAARRRAARTLSKGRHISSGYANSIGDKPAKTYETLKAEFPELGFGRIDGNGPPRSERYAESQNHPDAETGRALFT